MKKQEVCIYLNIELDGEKKQIEFDLVTMRNWLNNLKTNVGQENVEIRFDYNNKSYSKKINIAKELPLIKMAVKYGELINSIIPQTLAGYLEDLTLKIASKKMIPMKGREHEIEKAWFYLSQKTRNNVFLVGPKDVGKTAIAYEIARQISTNECPKEFYEKRVLMLKPELLLKIKSNYLFESKAKQLIRFLVKNRDKIILYVDKAIYLKSDIMLIYILYACVKKFNIPVITTSSEDNFDDYFYEDQSITKYVNSIYVDEPEFEEIEPMIRPHIKKLQKQHGIKISKDMINFGIYTSNLSNSVSANPGNVINIFERAFLEAKRKDKQEVDKKSILRCYNTLLKEYGKMSEEEKRATAYHEIGHWMLAVKSKHFKDIKISCVSNLPMNYWAGVTMPYYNHEEYAVHSKDYYIDYIAFTLAGRVAEKKYTNLNSVGASSDLEYASDIAKAMIMSWGFSEKPNNINRQYNFSDYYLMPECKKELIDKEIQELIDEATKRAEDVINENEELLKIVAEKLLVDEVLTGEQLKAICDEYEKNKSNK